MDKITFFNILKAYFLLISHSKTIKRIFIMNKLYRSSQNKMLAGVCAGVADFFGLDIKLVRLVWFIALLFGAGAILYIILWIVVPEK